MHLLARKYLGQDVAHAFAHLEQANRVLFGRELLACHVLQPITLNAAASASGAFGQNEAPPCSPVPTNADAAGQRDVTP